MAKFYLSFAGEHGFHGAAIVEADNEAGAVAQTHALKINPGGECMAIRWDRPLPDGYINRLLSRADVSQLDQAVAAGRH